MSDYLDRRLDEIYAAKRAEMVEDAKRQMSADSRILRNNPDHIDELLDAGVPAFVPSPRGWDFVDAGALPDMDAIPVPYEQQPYKFEPGWSKQYRLEPAINKPAVSRKFLIMLGCIAVLSAALWVMIYDMARAIYP